VVKSAIAAVDGAICSKTIHLIAIAISINLIIAATNAIIVSITLIISTTSKSIEPPLEPDSNLVVSPCRTKLDFIISSLTKCIIIASERDLVHSDTGTKFDNKYTPVSAPNAAIFHASGAVLRATIIEPTDVDDDDAIEPRDDAINDDKTIPSIIIIARINIIECTNIISTCGTKEHEKANTTRMQRL